MPVLRTNWHVFTAAPQCEGVVCRVLARRGIEALAPRTEAFEHERAGRSRSRVWLSQPVFPGYVFASIRGAQWGMLRLVPYLHPQPIAMDGVPYRLTEADAAMVRQLDANPLADPRKPAAQRKYLTGELVRILQGPFASFSATVDADKGRKLQVTTKVFGRPTPVTVPRHWVERAA